MASEVQTFHKDSRDLVETTCLGCHGILGQRQFQIDEFKETQECQNFSRDIVSATPLSDPEHANYGALARDGISCTSCHHMVLGEADTNRYKDDLANRCVAERQEALNPDNTGFARTFTGSFFVGPADTVYGPFKEPKEKPMQHALGITPAHNDRIQTSEICGTCHNVHLPVLQNGETLGHIYEQTTYSEWAFSDYRTGQGVDGPLPGGAGPKQAECQFCHTPNQTENGTLFKSRIASIQEKANFPEAEFTLPASDLDLPVREGFAKHTLVGLNLFLTEMFDQYPEVLGVAVQDPMLVSKGLDPIKLTKREMEKNAAHKTVDISVADPSWDETTKNLASTVSLESHVGHKFPSGVGFRRAFVHFEVLDRNSNVIWQSGKPNDAGIIVDSNDDPVAGELWWNDDCTPIDNASERPHQPHFQEITSQSEVQIYQELVSTPPEKGIPNCSHEALPEGFLTTSFLSICAEVKDNRLLPSGFLPESERIAIAKAQGAGADLATDTGSTDVDNDPDYITGGGDSYRYNVILEDGQTPAAVRASLYYQSIPPFYLQDRFCTAEGSDRDRLYYLTNNMDLSKSAARGWKLQIGESSTALVK
ncbi:MAG: hypothetical protein GKR95_19280 [Gammaproteobacteria bacterium]|nr:hypothetical protein [Gammaproteobacteria bacterium]